MSDHLRILLFPIIVLRAYRNAKDAGRTFKQLDVRLFFYLGFNFTADVSAQGVLQTRGGGRYERYEMKTRNNETNLADDY